MQLSKVVKIAIGGIITMIILVVIFGTSPNQPSTQPTNKYPGLTPEEASTIEMMQTSCSSSDYPSPEDKQKCQNLVDTQYKNFQTLNSHPLPTKEQAIELVQHYKGKNGKGLTVLESITAAIAVAYPNENILSNPSTSIGWYADEAGTLNHPIYQVHFQFKTYREDIDFIFDLDPFNNTVWAGNTDAANILQVVDNYEK